MIFVFFVFSLLIINYDSLDCTCFIIGCVRVGHVQQNGGREQFVVAVKYLKYMDNETGTITVSRRFSHIAIPLEPGLVQKGEAARLLWKKIIEEDAMLQLYAA